MTQVSDIKFSLFDSCAADERSARAVKQWHSVVWEVRSSPQIRRCCQTCEQKRWGQRGERGMSRGAANPITPGYQLHENVPVQRSHANQFIIGAQYYQHLYHILIRLKAFLTTAFYLSNHWWGNRYFISVQFIPTVPVHCTIMSGCFREHSRAF